jgi:hypothetical protein
MYSFMLLALIGILIVVGLIGVVLAARAILVEKD